MEDLLKAKIRSDGCINSYRTQVDLLRQWKENKQQLFKAEK